jgi:hypothetical protein
MTHPGWTFVAAALLSTTVASPATAPDHEPALAVVAGVSQYDLSGTGTTAFGAVRLELPIGERLVVEPGLTYLPYESQGGRRTHHLLPEVQLQVQTRRTIRPYLGVGVGSSWAVTPGRDFHDLTLSAATGVRVLTRSGWILGGELRVRTIDPWTGTTGDWGLRIARTF